MCTKAKGKYDAPQHIKLGHETQEAWTKVKQMLKQKIEHLNILVLDVIKLKWTGIRYFQSGNHKVFYSGNDKPRRNGMTLILRQNVAKIVKSYDAMSKWIISIILLRTYINITII